MAHQFSSRTPLDISTRTKLEELRTKLLQQHKILLEVERRVYEEQNGPIGGAGKLLSLLMSNPFFDWLHRISEIVVQIDEFLESEEATIEAAQELTAVVRMLFKASSTDPALDSVFMQRYKQVLQKDSAAVMAHSELQRLLTSDS
jgi:hypothetical protein